ncbi:MAG: phosphotransacetylase, partial [Ignavibacteriales bacterium]|nr:phosphotransacetylase [Ignavibacteriales bacterium]
VRSMVAKAQKSPKKIVYPEGEEEKIVRAAHAVYQDKIGLPVLLGNEDAIRAKVKELGFSIDAFELHDPKVCERCKEYGDEFYNIRQRRGVTRKAATELIREPNYYGAMMVKMGDADALIGGLTTHYPDMIRPALQTVGVREGFNVVSGLYIVIIRSRVFFFADTTVNIDPTAEQLAEIALTVADEVRGFDVEPRVAMLSFSNFGSVEHPLSVKVKKAVEIAQQKNPDLAIDGEMQADTAIVPDILKNEFPFAKLDGGANVLVFPNLAAGNIAYKLFERLTDATVIGPILVGMKKPVHVLQRGATVDDIINMTAIAVVEATRKQRA